MKSFLFVLLEMMNASWDAFQDLERDRQSATSVIAHLWSLERLENHRTQGLSTGLGKPFTFIITLNAYYNRMNGIKISLLWFILD